MTRRRSRKLATFAGKTADIALSAPPVMAYRLAGLAAAGARPSARDRTEMWRMVGEKQLAFLQSWNAMGMQMARQNLMLAFTVSRSFWFPLLYGMPSARHIASHWNDAFLGTLLKGLAPTHRAVLANHRRLSKRHR